MRALLLLPLLGATACATAPVTSDIAGDPVPHRVWDVAQRRFVDFDAFVARAASADVVFFGEQHGHVAGHRMQRELMERLATHGDATLSLEQFERDVAPLLDRYLAGGAALDSAARPWPRYASDYAPTVDFAKARGWRVIAANVPRPLASLVARGGLAALDTLSAATRAHAATQLMCPDDAYRTRFVETIRQHPMGPPLAPELERAREQRYYESQCVKDETMAESIVRALESGAARPVVHLTGAFHSDHGDGIPARVQRRMPGVRMLSITMIPVADLGSVDVAPHAARADYLLFTRADSTSAR